MGARQMAAQVLPPTWVDALDHAAHGARRRRVRAVRRVFGSLGFNVVKRGDFYSTLPLLEEIEATQPRWNRPSELVGLDVDVPTMQARLDHLIARWEADFQQHAGDYSVNVLRGFGPGYPASDARTLYYMLREHRPSRYLEVGSGLSTYYASLAAERNAADGVPMKMTCVEPYPFEALHTVQDIDLLASVAQDVPLEVFAQLGAGDLLFIDSTHAFKIDSDVSYLLLEVLPRLAPGVLVHIHDVPFPFNTPYPASYWMFGERWPVYWNEAMAVQAFLAFNSAFQIELSMPILRHADEAALVERFPGYVSLAEDPNPPSSLWLRRV